MINKPPQLPTEEDDIANLKQCLESEFRNIHNTKMSKDYYISKCIAEYYRTKYSFKNDELINCKISATSDAIVYINTYYDVIYEKCKSESNIDFYDNAISFIKFNFGDNLEFKEISSKLAKYNIRNYHKLKDIFFSIIMFTVMILSFCIFNDDIMCASLLVISILLLICVEYLSNATALFFSTPKRPHIIWD